MRRKLKMQYLYKKQRYCKHKIHFVPSQSTPGMPDPPRTVILPFRMSNVKLKEINYLIKKSYPHLNY